jgi:DNA-directed RNA polymerase
MSNTLASKEQLLELQKLGVGGKYKNSDNYLKLIERELDHEEYMVRGGQVSFNDQIKDAKAKGQESITLYGLILQKSYISVLSEKIHNDISLMNSGKAGNYHTALKLICQCLPITVFDNGVLLKDTSDAWDTTSLIILKNIIDGISGEITLNKLAIRIGNALMQEARILRFKEQNKKVYDFVQKKLSGKEIAQQKSKYEHKAKVWGYMMKRNNLEFTTWTNVEKLHVGVKAINYAEILGLVRHQNRKIAKNKTVTYVEATEKVIEDIGKFNIKNELLHPKYMPMIMPPKDWTNPFSGGYYGKKYNEKNNSKDIANALQLHKTNK